MIDPKELLFTVDENNQPVKPVKRSEAHKNGIWHRSTNVWVVNKNQILCQKRSLKKDTNPGKWEACFGGHLSPDDSYLSAAQRELKEEAGISLPDSSFNQVMIYKYEAADRSMGTIDREFLGIFVVNWSGNIAQIIIEEDEVEEIAWWPMEELKEIIGVDTNWVAHGYESELLNKLSSKEIGEI